MRRKHHDLPLYEVTKWASYHDLQRLREMTPARAVQRSQEFRDRFKGQHSLETITIYGLDNPFMTEDARQVMLNDCDRITPYRPNEWGWNEKWSQAARGARADGE